MLVIPKRKENAEEATRDMLLRARVPVEKVDSELIGNEIIVWLSTSQEKKAKEVLKKADIKSFTSEVIAVKLPDKPGELAKIARILGSSGITVKDAHLILKSQGNALYGITASKPREATKIIEKFEAFIEKEGKEER